jgi:putative ABC transport system substrate-binding protein
VEPAARAMGLQIQVLNASTSREIDAAFATLARERPDALFVGSDAFFNARRVQLANLASRHALPATFASRENAEAGELMTYGSNIVDVYRQIGVYAGRILKGASPSDLPVVQSTKFELVINARFDRRCRDLSGYHALLGGPPEKIVNTICRRGIQRLRGGAK